MATRRNTKHLARGTGCPVAASLDVFGDRWSLLIVRDLLFRRPRGFGDFAGAGEGIATNILSDRLARLEADGVISRTPDPADLRKAIYDLTSKGLALAPVVAQMVAWAVLHEDTVAGEAVARKARVDPEGLVRSLTRRWVGADNSR